MLVNCLNSAEQPLNPAKLADKLRAIADREQTFFRDLRRAV